MRVTYITVTDDDEYGDEDSETRHVFVGYDCVASASDGICPEDVQFYRDLPCPHEAVSSTLRAVLDNENSTPTLSNSVTFTNEEYEEFSGAKEMIDSIWGGPEENNWEVSVLYEMEQLDLKLKRLQSFIESRGFCKLSISAQELLLKQRSIQKQYIGVLNLRLIAND